MEVHPETATGWPGSRQQNRKSVWKKISRHWQLYLVVFLPVMYLMIFKYFPMYGAIIAFKEFRVMDGILGSPWAGTKYFEQFFNYPFFWRVIQNTVLLSVYSLIVGFPAPIILALALNEVRAGLFKKSVQLITFAPFFISTVVIVSMIIVTLSPDVGVVDRITTLLGMESINLMALPHYFRAIYIASDIWQFTGYGAVVYLAALAGINPELYEAAKIDGASRLKKIVHIDLPGIAPVIVILLILNLGQIMNVGFEKIYLMQNPFNLSVSEVIATYVYTIGLLGANFSFASAVGLFNSVINLVLLVSVNYVAGKLSETSLW